MSTANQKCEFISYKLSEEVLAEVFALGGITDVSFDGDAVGVRTVRSEEGLIFAAEGEELTLPQMLVSAWCGVSPRELGAEESALYDALSCTTGVGEKADCRSYKLEAQYSGSDADKLRVISELFDKTDIADRLEYTVTRAAKGGMETPFGVVGTEKISYCGGRMSYMLLVPAGMVGSENNAVLLMKDGELTISDRDGFEWQPETLERAMLALNEADAPKGVTVLKKLNCKNLATLTLPPVFLEVGEGALTGCPALEEVNIIKRNILLGRGFVNAGVTVTGFSGSSAEEYAKENGLGFTWLESVEFKPAVFSVSEGVCLTDDTSAVFRRQSVSRAMLNDVSFTPYEGAEDDFDCEIIDLSENEARGSGLTAQLEGFGSMIDTETVRNDRSGYIKATMMRSSERQDIFGYVLEIDHGGRVICLHTEKQFGDEELEKGADKALFERIKELGASVSFGAAPAKISTELPAFKVSETAPEPVPVEEPVIKPMTEEEPAPVEEPVIEPMTEEEPAPVEEPVIEPMTEEESAPVEEPVIELMTEEEPVLVEEPVIEPMIEEEPAPVEELVIESMTEEEPAPVEEPVIEPIAEEEPLVEAEDLGEQESVRSDEVIDVEPEDIRPADEVVSERLVRGARFDLSGYMSETLTVDMDYRAEAGLDIDGYVFLLKADGKVRSDADLVFFGQKTSVDGAVNAHPTNTRSFTVELSKLGGDISKLAVAYAIYGENAQQTFAGVSNPIVRISCNGRELCSYELEGLSEERSTVAVELYNKNGWKLRTVGLGYKEALKSLCGSYGVEVR